MTDKGAIGRRGEDAAARWLEANGFTILERNWRSGRYEIDIIARRGGQLHIIEVKCRAGGGLTRPGEAYTPAKFEALMRAAEAYIEENGIDADTRFDLVAVTHSGEVCKVEYVPDVMAPRW